MLSGDHNEVSVTDEAPGVNRFHAVLIKLTIGYETRTVGVSETAHLTSTTEYGPTVLNTNPV